MKKYLTLVRLFVFLFAIPCATAQVYPVQLSGTMIPPRSLDLDVYTGERRGDLFFNAILNDPVQASLPVRLDLTIENNGTTIYRTDPNFFTNPITLQQFQPYKIDGGVLQQYLAPESLTGQTGNGMGSLEVPEGFNRICLQVIGIDRQIPISNKSCVLGSFQLNQPPQLILPTCGTQMEYPETQNLIFNWQPMHIGSSNSPIPVEYRFELVELPPGTTNANDAFNSSLRLYSTTSMTPTLIYTQSEPLLQPEKLYAWRIKAYSMIHPTSKLFQNEGYSAVCTFRYYPAGEEPRESGQEDKQPPTGCLVFNTDYGPITGNPAEAIPIVEEDILKLGYFDMEITQAIPGASGYSGTAKITMPIFKSQVNVAYSGLRVNQNLRVFDATKITAIIDQQFKLDPSKLNPATIGNTINKTYVENVDNFFKTGQGQNRLVSGFNLANPVAVNLPLGMDSPNNPLLAVIGINFTPRNAYLNIVSWSKQAGNLLRFAGTGIQTTPFGVKSNSHLVPLNGVGTNSGGKPITDAFSLALASNNSVKMNFSCAGFKDLNLEYQVVISDDLLLKKGTNEEVAIQPQTATQNPETYIGEIKTLPQFVLKALPEFIFKPKKGKLDLSTTEKLQFTTPLLGYSKLNQPSWRGLVLEEVDLELPGEYNFTGSGNKFTIKGGSLIIDESTVAHSDFVQTNVLSMEQGQMGNWAYSVDSFYLKLSGTSDVGATLVGNLRVPIFSDFFKYSGVLTNNSSGQIILNVEVPNSPIKMDIWKATFTPQNNQSLISAKLADDGTGTRKFFPSAIFDGIFAMKFTDAEFTNSLSGNANQKATELKDLFDVSKLDFDISGVDLKRLELQPFSEPTNRYTLKDVAFTNAIATLDGTALTINDFQLVYDKKNSNTSERLGLKLSLSIESNKAEITFWAKDGSNRFEFEEIDLKIIKVQCKCLGALEPTSDETWGTILEEVIEKHYGHLFGENVSSGSLAAFGLSEKTEQWQSNLKATLKNRLRKNTLGGFPVLESGDIVISFLENKRLQLDENNKGVIDTSFLNRENYSFLNLDVKAADTSKINMLPFDVTYLLDNLGVTGKGIPTDARLLLSGFDVINSTPGSWQQSTMELTLVYQLNNEKHMRFLKQGIPVTTVSVDFSDLNMNLESDVTLNNGVKFIKGDGSSNPDKGSFAFMTCTKGFENFNLQGFYQLPFGDNEMKIKTPTNGGDSTSFQATKFEFLLNTPSSLKNFITPIKKTIEAASDWSFVIPGAEQLLFKPGADFEAYLDYDATQMMSNASNVGGGNTPDFKGIIFKNIEAEVSGLKDGTRQPVKVKVENAVYKKDVGIITNKISKKNLILRTQDAKLGGWKYEVSEISFEIQNGKLKPAKWNGSEHESGGVFVKGKLQLPNLKDLDNNPELQKLGYTSGWVGYAGTIDFNSDGGKSEPVAKLKTVTNPKDKFLLDFVPGMSMTPGLGTSTFAWSFDAQKKEFRPSAELNGTAEIKISDEIVKAYGSEVDPQTSGLAGVSLKMKNLKFQDLKIGGSANEPKKMEIGTWGYETSPNKKKPEQAVNFQGFPGSVGQPIFTPGPNNQMAFTLPTSLNLVKDISQPEDEAQTSGLNSNGSINFVANQSPTGSSFNSFAIKEFSLDGQFGPASVNGKLEISPSTAGSISYGFQTQISTVIGETSINAPIQIGVAPEDPTNRFFQISLNNPELTATPVMVDGRQVHSISGGLTPTVNQQLNPDLEVTGGDSARFFQILTINEEDNSSVSSTPPSSDNTPPTLPLNVTGLVDSAGNVTVSWDRSKSDDVAGYWLYWANSEEEELSQLNSKLITKTSYEYQIDAKSLNKTIYYSLRAEDKAFNRSAATPIIEVTRPDNVPPLAPFLTEVVPDYDGMEIRWTPSSSDDVENQILYKKIVSTSNDSEWLEVTRFDPSTTQYKDVFAQIDMEVQYRLAAIDEASNLSEFSNFKSASISFPFKEAIVTNFRIQGRKNTVITDRTVALRALKVESRKLISLKRNIAKEKAKLAHLQSRNKVRSAKFSKNIQRQYRRLQSQVKAHEAKLRRMIKKEKILKIKHRKLKRKKRRNRKAIAAASKEIRRTSAILKKLKRQRKALKRSLRKLKKKLKKQRSFSKKAFSKMRRSKAKIAKLMAKTKALTQKLRVQKATIKKGNSTMTVLTPTLRWNYNSRNNELATTPYVFEIYRSTGNKPIELLKSVDGVQQQFEDFKVEDGVLYNYSIRIRYINGWLGDISPIKSFRVRAN